MCEAIHQTERRGVTMYHVQRKIKGEWVTVTTLNWLAADRTKDKLQNRHGANFARMVKVDHA